MVIGGCILTAGLNVLGGKKKGRADVEMPVLGMCSVSLPVLKPAEGDRVSHGKSWKMEQNSKEISAYGNCWTVV